MTRRIPSFVAILALIAMLLGACTSPATPTQAPQPTQPPAPTQAPKPTEAPTPVPTKALPPTAEPTVAPAATIEPTAAAPKADLKVTGKVQKEMAWTEAEVKAMPTLQVESTNKKGEKATYTGVLIADLLKLAGPLPEATKVVFVANDGYTAEIGLAEVLACTDCIVSFRDQGGFSTVFPGGSGNLQVKGVVEIKVE